MLIGARDALESGASREALALAQPLLDLPSLAGEGVADAFAILVEAALSLPARTIYAELGATRRLARLEDALPTQLGREDLPWETAFLAGKCFVDYRRRGGARRSPLPDFYIGARAAITGRTLLTRDAQRYRTQLPTLALICP